MTSDQPRTAEFLKGEHVAHDRLWVEFTEELERENAKLLAAANRLLAVLGTPTNPVRPEYEDEFVALELIVREMLERQA